MMFGLGLLLTASYVPGWTDATILSGWVVLSLTLPFFLFNKIEMGPGHWLGLVFLAYATLSLAWAPVWQQGVWDLWLTWTLAFCFCLGAQRYDPRLWVGMALGLAVSDGFAVAQWFGYHPIFANAFGTEPGTYINPDMFGETACLVTIALIATRCYWPLVLTIPPIYFTQSRTVYVAYAAVIALALWDRWRWMALIPCLLLTLSVGALVTSNHRASTAERFALWQDTAEGVTAWGWGAGSFFMLYPRYARRTDTMYTRPEDPHNEYLNLAFEYGIASLAAFAILACGLAARGPERYILVAFLAIAFFSFPTRIPTEGFVGMVALGRLCRAGNMAWVHQLLRRSRGLGRSYLPRGADRSLESLPAHEVGI